MRRNKNCSYVVDGLYKLVYKNIFCGYLPELIPMATIHQLIYVLPEEAGVIS